MGGHAPDLEFEYWWAYGLRISVLIDNNGVATGGTLQIDGYLLEGGMNGGDPGIPLANDLTSGTLLAGNLLKFGWFQMDDAYVMFQFSFQVSGGDPRPYRNDGPAWVILSGGNFGNYATNPLFA